MNLHSTTLSLGTNSDNGMEALCQAEEILRSWIRLDSCSRKYRNPAIGMEEGTNDFHNMLIKTETSLSLQEMMCLAKRLESMMGNTSLLRSKGIVAMDMDIIAWDGMTLKPNDTEREYYKILIQDI